MVWWVSPRAYQTVLYRIIFYTISCKIPFKNFSNYYFFTFLFIFCNLKEIKFNSLLTVWNALGLSQQTTVSLNYSQSIKINIGPSDGGTIISSSRRPTVLNQRLTDLKIHSHMCSNILWKTLFQTVLEKAYSILLTEQLFWRSTEIRTEQPNFWPRNNTTAKAHRCHIYILSCFGNHYFGHFIKAKFIYKILAAKTMYKNL